MEGKMGEGGEILKNNEAPKTDPAQKAVETITTAKKEEVASAVEKKFPNPNELNEEMKTQDYKANKEQLVKNIINRGRNTEYNRTSPDNTEYRNDLLLSENTTQVKAYVAYYNLQLTKENVLNKTNKPMINIDTFMKNYKKEKPQATEKVNEETPRGVKMPVIESIQEVGKFIDISTEKQKEIFEKMGQMVAAGQKINKLVLHGYADATEVNAEGEKAVQEKFTGLRQTLLDKGMSADKLPAADYFKSTETMELHDPQRQKVLNDGRAYSRAMMQIAFLPAEHIKYINENAVSVVTAIDAKPVGSTEKGNEFTGGKIEMESTGSTKTTLEVAAVEERLLQMIDIRQVNYVYVEGNNYYVVGAVQLGNTDGKSSVTNIPFNTDSRFRSNVSGVLTTENKGKNTFFGDNKNMNTLYIVINDQNKTDQQAKDLHDIDARITSTGMNIANGANDIDAFVGALTEFKNKSTGEKNKESYVDNMTTMLEVYKQVDSELKQAQEIKKITL